MKSFTTFLERFRQTSFRNLLFVFAIVLLGFFSYFSYYRIKRMIDSSNLVNRTNLVILKIEQVLSITKDAETAQRGFLITSDSSFFRPAIGAADRVNKVLAEVRPLIIDKIQAENLDKYETLIHSRLDHLRISREYRFQKGYDPNILRSLLLDGKRSMDSVRSQAAIMERAEQKLLSERIKINERTIGAAPLFSLFISGILLLIIMVFFYILRRRYDEQKLIKNRLHESEKKFRSLLESAPDAMIIVNEEGMIGLVNAQAEKLFGYQRQELIGKQMGFLIPDRFQSAHGQHRKNYFKEPAIRSMGAGRELFAKRKNGEEIPVEISLAPLQTEDGLLVSAAIRDITEKKKTQEAIIESEKLSVMAAMSGTIAHEIRNPLTNINLSVEILKDRLPAFKDFPEVESSLNIISRNYERIDRLVKDLLYSYKAEKRNFSEVDLAEIVEDVLIVAADRILLKGILLEKSFGKNYTISADSEALKIALLNIVINAIEAMGPDAGLLQISMVKNAETIMLTFRDNGIGMTQEEMAKMFNPYYTKKPSGLGVGLANVKSILQNHNAKTEVMSEAGKGTAFTISIPSATA